VLTGAVPAPGPVVTVCDGCCCGTRRKHPGVDHEALRTRLATAVGTSGRVRTTGCIDACERSNVAVVTPSPAGRRAGGRPVWLGGVVVPSAVDGIAAWVRAGGPGLASVPPDVELLVFPRPQSGRTG
jgi:hypothetical protein